MYLITFPISKDKSKTLKKERKRRKPSIIVTRRKASQLVQLTVHGVMYKKRGINLDAF